MPVDWSALTVDNVANETLLATMKRYMGITTTDKDEALSRALEHAGATIERFIDRQVAKREVTEHYEHHFGTVELHHMPAAKPLTVVVDGIDQSAYFDMYLARGKQMHLTRIGHSWDTPMDWRRYEQVDVTYVAGWDPLPVDLADAIMFTALEYARADGTGYAPGGGGMSEGSGEIKSMTLFDVGSVSYDVGTTVQAGAQSSAMMSQGGGFIPAIALDILWSYKRFQI